MLASLEPVDRILVVGHFALNGGGADDAGGDGESCRAVEGTHQAEVESGDSEDAGAGF